MSFRPVQMEKIRIICHREKTHVVLSILHDLKVVQVEEVGQDVKNILKNPNIMSGREEVIEKLNTFRSYENLLPRKKVNGRKKFESVDEIMNAASGIRIEHDVKVAYETMEQLKVNLKDVDNKIEILQYLKNRDALRGWHLHCNFIFLYLNFQCFPYGRYV